MAFSIPEKHITETKAWTFFCLLMMAFCFGSMIPFAKASMEHGMPQFTLSGLRMWGTAAFFWILSAGRPPCPVPLRDKLLMTLAGFLSIALDQGLFILGLSYTSPVDAGVICTLIPVFALILGIIFKGVRPSRFKVLGIAVGLAGAVTIVVSTGGGGGREGTVLGDAIVIAAFLCFACYLVFFTELLSRYPVQVLMKWMFLTSATAMLPFIIHDSSPSVLAALPAAAWLEAAYVVFGGTICAFLFLLEGQKRSTPEVVGAFNYLQPVVTCALSAAMGLGSFTPAKTLGTVLVFIGVAAVSSRER